MRSCGRQGLTPCAAGWAAGCATRSVTGCWTRACEHAGREHVIVKTCLVAPRLSAPPALLSLLALLALLALVALLAPVTTLTPLAVNCVPQSLHASGERTDKSPLRSTRLFTKIVPVKMWTPPASICCRAVPAAVNSALARLWPSSKIQR